ncbi:MAG TPA: sugar transferase [Caulobacteraceae bacterium]|jgi:lipopolysaccharide/colanic/teichoic acid biosynthesis glycosyltransferase|nr:sugar transferase [Caulobacteraceae bacterium]
MDISANACPVGVTPQAGELTPEPSLRVRRRRALAALATAAGAVCLFVLPPLYFLSAFHGGLASGLQPDVIAHLATICVANLVVAVGALRSRGRLDQRLAALFRLTLFTHGGVALCILVLRLFYSVPLMALGVGGSVALGSIAIYARGRIVRPRIGVLGPWHPIYDDLRVDCVRLEPTSQTLGDLDLLLLTFRASGAPWVEPLVQKALLRGLRVRHVAEYLEEARGACDLAHFEIDQVSGGGFVVYRRAKRALDLTLVLIFLPAALPILILAALGVLLTMGWPMFYIQPRIGLGGRPFSMPKLRTMRTGGDDADSRATSPRDERVTPLGRILRRFRIDELPQLANVLRGEMSMIGPRPEWAPLAEDFERQEPKYALRHLVRPGITGWAQVRAGPAADLAETRVKLAYDLFYLKHMSFALDLQILWRTSWTLLAGGGAR